MKIPIRRVPLRPREAACATLSETFSLPNAFSPRAFAVQAALDTVPKEAAVLKVPGLQPLADDNPSMEARRFPVADAVHMMTFAQSITPEVIGSIVHTNSTTGANIFKHIDAQTWEINACHQNPDPLPRLIER